MGNFNKIIAEGRQFACSLYKAQPGALIPNPISDMLKLPWDALCGDNDPANLPPPPSRPFTGGQCEVVNYNVAVEYTGRYQGNPLVDVYVLSVWGKVGSVSFEIKPNGVLNTLLQCHGYYAAPYSPALITVQREGYQTAGVTEIRISKVTITRPDGQPDNCGDPSTSYPSAPPPPIGGYNSLPVVINYNDGTSYTVVYNLKPPTDPSSGVPEICVTATIGGVQQKICYPFDRSPRLENPLGGDPQLGQILQDLKGLKDDYEFDSNPPLYADNDDVSSSPRPPATEGDEDVDNLLGVLVTLTKNPQDMQMGSPPIFFAGWLTFKAQGGYEVRHPIHFEQSYFPASEGATGYAYTFTKGAEGSIVAYSKKA